MHCADFVLYVTAGCALCDAALALLLDIDALRGRSVDCVDVADDAGLAASHGARIPVLRHAASGRELAWPFDAGDVLRLAAHAP